MGLRAAQAYERGQPTKEEMKASPSKHLRKFSTNVMIERVQIT